MPKISVIMAVRDGGKYLDDAIKSILEQTIKDFEFIIVNDASTDGSLEKMKTYQKRDKRIKIIHNRTNIGLTKSLNKALKLAKGKYIARQDGSDISLPQRLKIQAKYLEKNPGIFLIGCSAVVIDENGSKIGKIRVEDGFKKIERILIKKNCIIHPSIMFRNDKRTHYRNKFIYAQDYDLYLRLLSRGEKLTNIPQYLIKYRIEKKSISLSRRKKQNQFAIQARKFYKQRRERKKDQYKNFNPNLILKIAEENKREGVLLEKKILYYFKNNNLKEANKLFKNYKNLKNTSIKKVVPIYLILRMPFIYKIYKKLFK